jgi:type II secretion system protein N
MKKILFAIILAFLIFYSLWFIGVSEGFLKDLIQHSLQDTSLSVDIHDFRKGLFFNVTSQSVTLKYADKTLLSMEKMGGRIHPLQLFLMRVALSFDGEIGKGRIQGKLDLLSGGHQAHLRMDQANIEGIDFFDMIGLRGNGLLSGELKLNNERGDLKFSIKEARFERGSFAGGVAPLDLFDRARGAMSIKGKTLRVSSFSMEGKGIYARVKGEVIGNKVDLILEVMRDSSFRETFPLLSAIESYQVSPGYYVIPIKTVLSF